MESVELYILSTNTVYEQHIQLNRGVGVVLGYQDHSEAAHGGHGLDAGPAGGVHAAVPGAPLG